LTLKEQQAPHRLYLKHYLQYGSIFFKAGFSLRSVSFVVPNLGNSSVSKITGSPFGWGIATGRSHLEFLLLLAASVLSGSAEKLI